jgi:hypothetical protein
MEVAKADGDKSSNKITLQDFRNILTYKPHIKDPLADAIEGDGMQPKGHQGGGMDSEEEEEAQFYSKKR